MKHNTKNLRLGCSKNETTQVLCYLVLTSPNFGFSVIWKMRCVFWMRDSTRWTCTSVARTGYTRKGDMCKATVLKRQHQCPKAGSLLHTPVYNTYSIYFRKDSVEWGTQNLYTILCFMCALLHTLYRAFYTVCSFMSHTSYMHFSYKLYVMCYCGNGVPGDPELNWMRLSFGRKPVLPGIKRRFLKPIGLVFPC